MNQPLFFLQSKKTGADATAARMRAVGERPGPSHFFTNGKKMAGIWMRRPVSLQTRRP